MSDRPPTSVTGETPQERPVEVPSSPEAPTAPDPAVDTAVTRADSTTAANGTSLADTSGTGTIVALGCIGATLFLIVIGLLYLGITQLFG